MPPLQTTPCTATEIQFSNFDFKKQLERYEATGNIITMVAMKSGKSVFQLLFKGYCTTSGVVVSNEYGTHSFAFAFDDPADLAAITEYYQLFESVEGLEEYTLKECIKDDQLWIKMKYTKDKSSYIFQSKTKMSPKKPDAVPIFSNTELLIIVEMKGYINFERKEYGLSFAVKNMDIID